MAAVDINSEMALRSRNSSCSKSTEQRVFAKWFASLLDAITPMIDELTAQFYSAEFIERATKNDDTGTAYQRANRVLRCVEISVDRNPRKIYQFLDVMAQYPTLSDIAQSMRQSCITVTGVPQRGHSKLRTNTDVKEHPLAHTQRQPPDQVENVVDELSELQLTCSSQSKLVTIATDGSSEMLAGPAIVNHGQETYLSDSAAVRHAQLVPSMTVAVPEEEGSFVPFRHTMSGGIPLIEKTPVAAMDDRMLSTVEERTPIQSSDCLELNFDTNIAQCHCVNSLHRSVSSISSSSCDSRPTSMIIDSELDEEDRLLDRMKETVDAYHEVHRQEKKNIRCLNKKLEEKENRLKHKENKMSKLIAKLKLTQEVASENSEQCDKLTKEITLMESQIQLLKRHLNSAQIEHKRLNEHLEEVARQHRKLLDKYQQLLAEKDDGYYDKYCDVMKENQHLRNQLEEYKKKIELLQGEVDYLLQTNPAADVEDSLEGEAVLKGQCSAKDHNSSDGQKDEPPDSTITTDPTLVCDNK